MLQIKREATPRASGGVRRYGNPGRIVNLCFLAVFIFSTLLTWREIAALEASWRASQQNTVENVSHGIEAALQVNLAQLLFYRNGMLAALDKPLQAPGLRSAEEAYQRRRGDPQWSVHLHSARTLGVYGISDALVDSNPLLPHGEPRHRNEFSASLEGGYLLHLAAAGEGAGRQFYYVSRSGFYLTNSISLPEGDIRAHYQSLISAPWFSVQSQRNNPGRGVRWSSWLTPATEGGGRRVAASLPLDNSRTWYGVLAMTFPLTMLDGFLADAAAGIDSGEYQLMDSAMRPLASTPGGATLSLTAAQKQRLTAAFAHDTRGALRLGTAYVNWQKLRNFDGVLLRVRHLNSGLRDEFSKMSLIFGLLWAMFTSLLLLCWRVIRKMVRNMSAMQSSLQWQAWYDGLTSLYNRNTFFNMAADAARRARETGEPLAIIQLDLDNFKRINDTYGHQAGDKVLTQAAAMMVARIREGDIAGRVGGEEFCIILPGATLGDACAIAERIRARICRREVLLGKNQTLRISASLGVSASDEQGSYEIEHLQSVADRRLYRAKRLGRNQVCCGDGDDV